MDHSLLLRQRTEIEQYGKRTISCGPDYSPFGPNWLGDSYAYAYAYPTPTLITPKSTPTPTPIPTPIPTSMPTTAPYITLRSDQP